MNASFNQSSFFKVDLFSLLMSVLVVLMSCGYLSGCYKTTPSNATDTIAETKNKEVVTAVDVTDDSIKDRAAAEVPENIVKDSAIDEATNDIVEDSAAIEVVADSNVEPFSMEDLKFQGLTFGSTQNEVTKKFGKGTVIDKGEWPATCEEYIIIDYKKFGLNIIFTTNNQSIYTIHEMTINENSSLKIKRGLGIGSSKEDVLKSYPKDSILDHWDEYVIVGFPGDIDEYSSDGRIFFTIKDGKVTKISYSSVYAE